MINITLPLFDECRSWIRNARKRKKDWKVIEFALQSDEPNLEKKFLEEQKKLIIFGHMI